MPAPLSTRRDKDVRLEIVPGTDLNVLILISSFFHLGAIRYSGTHPPDAADQKGCIGSSRLASICMAVARHAALNRLTRAKPIVSFKYRGQRAAWNADYLKAVPRGGACAFKQFAWHVRCASPAAPVAAAP